VGWSGNQTLGAVWFQLGEVPCYGRRAMFRYLCLMAVGGAVLLGVASQTLAQWIPVYGTDFSSDPQWTRTGTGAESNYYWNATAGNYHFKEVQAMDQTASIPIPYNPNNSYKLSFDICLTRCDWAGYANLGTPIRMRVRSRNSSTAIVRAEPTTGMA
jgi:hypothetical protein